MAFTGKATFQSTLHLHFGSLPSEVLVTAKQSFIGVMALPGEGAKGQPVQQGTSGPSFSSVSGTPARSWFLLRGGSDMLILACTASETIGSCQKAFLFLPL